MTIAIAGGYGAGMTMRVAVAPAAGETVTGGRLSIEHGGKGSNQAVAAARLGASVSLFTAVGRDGQAEAARRLWKAEGVEASAALEFDGATMAGFIIVDATGENRIAIAPGALEALTPGHAERFREAIRSADFLLVSLEIPLEVAIALLQIAREEGTRTILNPAPAPSISIPASTWPLIDIVTPNQSEASQLLGEESVSGDPLEMALRLHRLTGSTVVLTAGAFGARVADEHGDFAAEPVAVDAVRDSTGAGDAFSATLAVALSEGASLQEAVDLASAAGALTVMRDGVIPGLPTRSELEDFRSATSHKGRGTP